jgi:hypothetical protein
MSEDQRGDGWWMANDGIWYPPERHPSATGISEEPAASRHTEEGRHEIGTVGPQFPDLFQAALQGNHLADNVSVQYDGEDERNVPVSVGVGASAWASTPSTPSTRRTRDGVDAPSAGPVGEFTGATAAKRRWRRH